MQVADNPREQRPVSEAEIDAGIKPSTDSVMMMRRIFFIMHSNWNLIQGHNNSQEKNKKKDGYAQRELKNYTIQH